MFIIKLFLAFFSLPVPVAGFEPLLLGLLVMYSTTALPGLDFVFAKLVTMILILFLQHRCYNYNLVALKVLLPWSLFTKNSLCHFLTAGASCGVRTFALRIIRHACYHCATKA